MKKLICLALAVMMLMLTACGDGEPKTIYKDTLVITNEEKTFEGAKERYRAVLESLRTRVTLLEESHNQSVKLENPDSYFLDDNYILRSFDPFAVASFEMTDKINDSVTPESAPDIFKDDAGNSSVIFSRDGSGYILQFMNEGLTSTYQAEYDAKTDSFRFIYNEDGQTPELKSEFLEFITVSDGTYIIQSNKSRCYIVYDEDGNIVSFTCSTLKEKEYTPDDSVYGASAATLTVFKSKIDNGKKTDYESIREYSEGVLTHIDTVEDKVNEIQIYADIYASAFVQ